MALTNEQLDRLGNAVANVEAAVEGSPEALRGHPAGAAGAIGDALVMALALKGFVLVDDADMATLTLREMEAAEAMQRHAAKKSH